MIKVEKDDGRVGMCRLQTAEVVYKQNDITKNALQFVVIWSL